MFWGGGHLLATPERFSAPDQPCISAVPEPAETICTGMEWRTGDEKAALDVPGLLHRGVHGRDGQPHRYERAAGDPAGPGYRPGGPGVDGQRLHADLRRAAADRRGAG